jgi:hypothetical protein
LSNFKLGEFLVISLSAEGSSLMSRSSCFTCLLLSRDETREHAEEEEVMSEVDEFCTETLLLLLLLPR